MACCVLVATLVRSAWARLSGRRVSVADLARENERRRRAGANVTAGATAGSSDHAPAR